MIRTFEMVRVNDETGVSGVGKVLEGVIFSDGTCTVRWVTEKAPRSTQVWESFVSFAAIHISPHPTNETKVVFSDGEVYGEPETRRANGVGPVQGVQRRKRRRKATLPGVGVPQPEAVVRESNVSREPEKVHGPEAKEAK